MTSLVRRKQTNHLPETSDVAPGHTSETPAATTKVVADGALAPRKVVDPATVAEQAQAAIDARRESATVAALGLAQRFQGKKVPTAARVSQVVGAVLAAVHELPNTTGFGALLSLHHAALDLSRALQRNARPVPPALDEALGGIAEAVARRLYAAMPQVSPSTPKELSFAISPALDLATLVPLLLGGDGLKKLSALSSALRSSEVQALGAGDRDAALGALLRHSEEAAHRTLLGLYKLPGFSALAPELRTKAINLFGGTNLQISKPARAHLATQLEALGKLSPEAGAKELSRLLQDQPELPTTVHRSPTDFSGFRTVYTTPKGKPEQHVYRSTSSKDSLVYDLKVGGYAIPIHQSTARWSGTPLAPKRLFEELARLPPVSLSLIKNLILEPGANPDDPWFASKFGESGFQSAASASAEGTVWMWNDWASDAPSSAQGVLTLLHETAHTLSFKYFGQDYEAAGWDPWRAAIAADGVRPSTYARKTVGEDFSESYALYWSVRGTAEEPQVRALMPQRFALIEELIAKQEAAMKASETDAQRAIREHQTALNGAANEARLPLSMRSAVLEALTAAPEDPAYAQALLGLIRTGALVRLAPEAASATLSLGTQMVQLGLDASELFRLASAPAFGVRAPQEQLQLLRAGGVVAANNERPLFQAALAAIEGPDPDKALAKVLENHAPVMFDVLELSFAPGKSTWGAYASTSHVEHEGRVVAADRYELRQHDFGLPVTFLKGDFTEGQQQQLIQALQAFDWLETGHLGTVIVEQSKGQSSVSVSGDALRVSWDPATPVPERALHEAAVEVAARRVLRDLLPRWSAAQKTDGIAVTAGALQDPVTDFRDTYLLLHHAPDPDAIRAALPGRTKLLDATLKKPWIDDPISKQRAQERLVKLSSEPGWSALSFEQQARVSRGALRETRFHVPAVLDEVGVLLRHVMPKVSAKERQVIGTIIEALPYQLSLLGELCLAPAYATLPEASRLTLLRKLAVAVHTGADLSPLARAIQGKRGAGEDATALAKLVDGPELLIDAHRYRGTGIGSSNEITLKSSEPSGDGALERYSVDGRPIEIFRPSGDKTDVFNGLSSIPARAKELISDLTLEAQSPKSEVGRVELREDGKLHATPFGGYGSKFIPAADLVSSGALKRAVDQWGLDRTAGGWKTWSEAMEKDGVHVSARAAKQASGPVIGGMNPPAGAIASPNAFEDFRESVLFYLEARTYLASELLDHLESAREVLPHRFALIEALFGWGRGPDLGFTMPGQEKRWSK